MPASPPGNKTDINDHKKHHDTIVKDEKDRLEQEGNKVSDGEITFESCDGNGRCRPDIVYETPDRQIRGVDVKTGDAKLSKNQEKIYPQMGDGKAIPVGKNAKEFGLKPNLPLKNGIPVEVKRFPGAGQ